MNPCPCGYFGHPTHECTCTATAIARYHGRVSGPLRDRLDLQVEMEPIAFEDLRSDIKAESSAAIRTRVLAARAIQQQRFAAAAFANVHCNAQLSSAQVRRVCRLSSSAEQLLRTAYDSLGLSARAHDRILRVARTIADLAGQKDIDEAALMEALQYRGSARPR